MFSPWIRTRTLEDGKCRSGWFSVSWICGLDSCRRV
jgi:hypothetical protein